jgi:hypothetical protein
MPIFLPISFNLAFISKNPHIPGAKLKLIDKGLEISNEKSTILQGCT